MTGVKVQNYSVDATMPYCLTDINGSYTTSSYVISGSNNIQRDVDMTGHIPTSVKFKTSVDASEAETSAYAILKDGSAVYIGGLSDSGDNGSGGWKLGSKEVSISTVAGLVGKISDITAIRCHASGNVSGTRISNGFEAVVYVYVKDNSWID